MRRRLGAMLGFGGLVVGILLTLAAAPALATPVASNEATYQGFGRAFPDPHGCTAGAPTTSPWAKGNVCAIQYLQWGDTLDGLRFLEERFDRYLEVMQRSHLHRLPAGREPDRLRARRAPSRPAGSLIPSTGRRAKPASVAR